MPAAVVHHRSSATSDLLGLFNRGFLFERNAFLTAYKNYEPGLWEKMMPAILLTFGTIVWKRGFTAEDRTLFRIRKGEKSEPTLPPPLGTDAEAVVRGPGRRA